ncbi:hypothetical protein Syun_020241 [Stephania yunnanensis]|uniref:Molybdenum cofactor sulfurase n=1 Tax=Stephania yunnanensis TaxID=152371 RepID=A0AAP0IDG4_9MAGN
MFLPPESKDMVEAGVEESQFSKIPNSPLQNGRPSSMIVNKAHTVIPAHLVAEAISQLHGLDLIRWSGPITPSEMQYVQQYVFTKYPQYSNGLLEDGDKNDLQKISINEESSETITDDRRKSPRGSFREAELHLDPRNPGSEQSLKHCGLSEEEYLVLFTPNYKVAMMLVGESYPFFRGNFYMTVLAEEVDCIREFATYKDSKVIPAPETWLDLRIKGSQLSQYFRRKCKHAPKGLFSYPAEVNGTSYSMHWVSEAHRNSWHVLLDATGLVVGEDKLNLLLHRPDFLLCTLDNTHAQPSKITCLLVRRKSFDAASSQTHE